jgi:PKD repeat protein
MKGILKDKLENMEMQVPEHLWANVSSQIKTGSAASTSAAATGTVWTKVALWAVAAAACTGITIWSLSHNNSSSKQEKNNVAETTPAATNEVNAPANQVRETSKESATPYRQTETETEKVAVVKPSDMEVLPDNQSNPKVIAEPTPTLTPMRAAVTPDERSASEVTHPTELSRAEIAELPSASALFDVVSSQGSTFEFKAQASNNAASYQWNFGDGGMAHGHTVTHTYREQGEFEVVLTAYNGQGKHVSSQQSIAVQGHGNIEVANVITPNNDGQNDVFDPAALAPSAEIGYLLVMNFDGQKIYESTSVPVWDGKLGNGEFAPAGSYLYLIRGHDKNSGIIEKSARLTVIR